MKRFLVILMLFALALPLLVACDNGTSENSQESEEESSMAPDANAQKVWKDIYADKENGLTDANAVYKLQQYVDGVASTEYGETPSGDTRYIFEGLEKSRAVVLSEGYALTLPSA